MKNMKAVIFTLLLLLLSPAVFGLAWSGPYWLPIGTSDPHSIGFGSTATAHSGDFTSLDTTVHYRAELRRADGSLVTVLEERDIDISVFTGWDIVEIEESDYVEAGEYWVRFTVSDSVVTRSEQLRLVVGPEAANNPPVLNHIADKTVYEDHLLQFYVSGSDPDGDDITFSAAGLPSGASFSPASRRFSWTPDFDQAGDYSVTFIVTDEHGDTDSQTMTIHVRDTNRCPVMDDVPDQEVREGRALSFSVGASDPDGEELFFSASDLPAGAGFDTVSRIFSWTPGYDQAGVYDVTFHVEDGECWDSDTVRITVTDDSAPSVDLVALPSGGPEGTTVHFVCSASGGDEPLSYVIDFGDEGSVASDVADHTYSTEGIYNATCTVTDADGDVGSDSEEITIDDNAPVVELIASPMSGEAPLAVDFTCDVAGGNAPFAYLIEFGDGSPGGADDTASHTYTSEGVFVATCTVMDTDGDLGSDTVGIDVSENRCPSLGWYDDMTVRVGETLEFDLEALDADGDDLTFWADMPFTPFLTADGHFSWTPVELQIGDHSATFRVTDGVCEDSTTINIEVLPALPDNHAPEANFTWSPETPQAGEEVMFNSTSTDPDGDSLTCGWDFDDDGWSDSDDCFAVWTFEAPGDYPVTLTVSDGEFSDSVTHTVNVLGQLNVTSIDCFDPVVEDSLQSCSVRVESSHGASVGGANAVLFYDGGSEITNCITDSLTGSCVITFPTDVVGNYTVYATAEKPGWSPDLDADPTASFQVLARRYVISNLAVYNDSGFTQEDYDFFRGEDMFVHFMVLDESGAPADDLVTSVALVSPPGGVAWFDEFAPNTDGNYWYDLRIPVTHDFLGDSQVFTFAFNFSDGSGSQMVVEVVIRNNPPVIDPAVVDEFDRTFDDTTIIGLSPYESDVEDSGRGLQWSVLGVDHAVAEVSVDMDDFLTVTPLAPGYDIITLVLSDLDGDVDTIDVPVNTGGSSLAQCEDGIDNDGDGLIDMADPGCESPEDDDESDDPVLPQCSDGIDNDGDGLIDLADPGCSDAMDDDESDDPSSLPQCSDGIDNDGDGLIDMADPGCESPEDDDETDPVTPPQCSDGVDNDGDGLIDMADPGCEGPGDDDETDPVVLPQCSDGIDNDGDGLIDMADPGCDNPADDDETDPVLPQCSDGIDNDGDGLIDMEDPDCLSAEDDNEAHVPQCADGVDNDGDGLVDLADPGCTDASDDDETDFAGNQPPVAVIDLSRAYGAPGVIIDVDGSGSYDPDGVVAEHSWVITGPGNYTYSDLHVPGLPGGFAVQFFEEGLYEFRLTVVDGEGAGDTEVVAVTISSGLAQCDNGLDDDGDGLVDWQEDPHCADAYDDLEGEIDVSTDDMPFRDEDELLINRVDINGHDVEAAVVEPGNYYRLSVALQNNLDYSLEDIRVDMSIQELGIRNMDLLRELEPGETSTVVLNLGVPEWAEPGLYDLRVVVSNDDVRRVKYRVVTVA